MNADQLPSQEIYRDEYKIISEEHRFFGSVRFITAGFALRIQAALFTLFNQAVKDDRVAGIAVAIMAVILLGATVIIERRTIILSRLITRRGSELEFQLGLLNGIFHRFEQLPERWRVITHTWGINTIYLSIFVFWLVLCVTTLAK